MPGQKARLLRIFYSPVVSAIRLKTKELSASSLMKGCPKGRPFFSKSLKFSVPWPIYRIAGIHFLFSYPEKERAWSLVFVIW